MTFVRVLVVDDYEPFCRFVDTILQNSNFTVVGRSSDGLDAVRKAEELQPDLILLDIGLPRLNGLEAAERIGKVAPRSKIVFVSQESSSPVVEAAFRLGAVGYVHKSRVYSDLLTAIESAFQGRQFVSQGLEVRQRTVEMGAQSPNRHEVLFYSDVETLIDGIARFIEPAMRSGDLAIVFATETHRAALTRKLNEDGLDVEGAVHRGTYISIDAPELLVSIMVNGLPDGTRFFNALEELIRSGSKAAGTRHPRTALCGECLGLLCAEGNTNAAIHFEKLADVFLNSHENIDFLCAYPLSAFDNDERKGAYDRICKEHSAVHAR